MINVSIGTAAVLGLTEIQMEAAPTTAYLMLGGRCALNCGFCAQARSSHAGALHLSRITWPQFDLDETISRLVAAVGRGDIKRACLQVTVSPGYFRRTLEVVRAIRAASAVPVDAAILPRNVHQVEQLLAAGVDHIGFGLDAACERVFRRVKGRDWDEALALVEATARQFPARSAVHLIVGLGETEEEMVRLMQQMHDLGVVVGLFAFTPVPGTAMESSSSPPLDVYRRMQTARYLIVHDLARAEQFTFREGRVSAFNVPRLRDVLADGVAFQTSGCPDCNRPFYNERPGGVMYNYPRPLTPVEARQAIVEMGLVL
ncbi:MAG: radical SAM protein [Anaerolineae bacterium]|jgi:biotin synthase|nr:radical SAM protein [Anaerolineae bacterium]MDH7472962.1 radical SAM protein [Anaerolineae bacterium]